MANFLQLVQNKLLSVLLLNNKALTQGHNNHSSTMISANYEPEVTVLKGPFSVAYQNLTGRCLVCKHGSHVINIPKADWSSVKNKELTATPC